MELDPNFGLGYQGLALMSRNLGRLEEAEQYIDEALKHLDGMTERERFAVRGFYYLTTGDYQQCVKEYGELIAQFAADPWRTTIARSVCRNCETCVRPSTKCAGGANPAETCGFRGNLALYADYAGDFQAAEREVKALEEPTDHRHARPGLRSTGTGPAAGGDRNVQEARER